MKGARPIYPDNAGRIGRMSSQGVADPAAASRSIFLCKTKNHASQQNTELLPRQDVIDRLQARRIAVARPDSLQDVERQAQLLREKKICTRPAEFA